MDAIGPGIFTISIELDSTTGPQQRDQLARRILERLVTRQFAGVWFVANPSEAKFVDVLSATQGQEVGLTARRDWVGADVGRPAFARELNDRLAAAAARGMAISSLALGDLTLAHADLAMKSGLTAIVSRSASRDRHAIRNRARAGRHGLWEIPSGDLLTDVGRFSWLAARRAIRRLDQHVTDGGIYHLAIDAAAASRSESASLSTLDTILRHADLARHRGTLVHETFAGVARQLSAGRQSTAARSILRPAA